MSIRFFGDHELLNNSRFAPMFPPLVGVLHLKADDTHVSFSIHRKVFNS
ncbi:hypothetical protein HanXRQr2_Chr16g0756861 [Helianthus annuus]|uniref:Uncharacterized protein n=1 Tax=Helianthus annuus TaxID=4232 RepID=A0A9K3DTI4_HELAN|nr:hypothetical protein HanXRQr2_Chr16g0756861 [Helianthus annuus]KAJ0821879.1 hypothetical protein HanPSC8_Chr16g0725381 [Helianthus annuus]